LAVRCAVSSDAADLARQHLGGPYELVFNGIEIERFATATPSASDGPAVFFLGRHEPRKGLRTLLEAMAFLPEDVALWIGSDGPETEELRAEFPDPRFQWLGRLTDLEKAERMRGASVACFPSLRGESFGVVLLEAMAAGVPVVASDLPGYRNVARPDNEALMVPPGDPTSLAAALKRVLEDPSLAASLRSAGDARAAHFSMASLATRYLGIYEQALWQRGAPRR
ncbi:MAG: pimA, partial [Acidimicrobiia bacterium]|nr:pimA [Acidimicrobiia bacterium]